MKLRYKAPSGGGFLEIDEQATVLHLLELVKSTTGFSDVSIKYGWPPQTLDLAQAEIPLQSLGLQRESLTIVPLDTRPSPPPAPAAVPPAPPAQAGLRDQNVTVPMEGGSSLVLRVMPDDNSCMFTAVGGALRGLSPSGSAHHTPESLRRVVVDHIRADPVKFDAVVLESEPERYCAQMLRPDTWGGGIELGILSEHFGIEISCVDVRTNNVVRFGEGQFAERCMLVYSNIHYDRVAETFVDNQEVDEFDVTLWSVATSDHIVRHTQQMCRKLKEDHHYYTDASDFVVQCNDCGWVGQGQKALAEHSLKTAHTNISEITVT